jgi:hypothetical protein
MIKEKRTNSGLIVRKEKEFVEGTKKGKTAIKLEALENSTITENGLEFNADEKSQNRMLNTISSLEFQGYDGSYMIDWKLANNTIESISLGTLKNAFIKANTNQYNIWMEI